MPAGGEYSVMWPLKKVSFSVKEWGKEVMLDGMARILDMAAVVKKSCDDGKGDGKELERGSNLYS